MKKFCILLLVAMFSCQPSGESELKVLKDEVMAIHDEVMPQMGDLRRTRKDLMLQADSLMASDSVRATELNDLASKIEGANEGMMQWMRAYEPDFAGSDEEIKNYLEAQKQSIEKVRDEMKKSLADGKNALE